MHSHGLPAVYGATLATEAEPGSVLLPGHDVPLGRYTTVRRLLPQRPRRVPHPPVMHAPAQVHSPLVCAELRLAAGAAGRVPLVPEFEHAALVMTGATEVAGTVLTPGSLLYLGRGREQLELTSAAGARLFLLGGEPFDEPLVMWWNFVGRTHEEIAQARADWMSGRRFGVVHGFAGDPLPAPEMPTVRLKPRGRDGSILDG